MYEYMQNKKLNKDYNDAVQQVASLQSRLQSQENKTDVYTLKTNVQSGQEIKADDLTLTTYPVSNVPANAIIDLDTLVGSYYRINLQPGTLLTTDVVIKESYEGAVYDKDVFLDLIPVGTKTGDYIDVRVTLPGGEDFVVFPHKRVNSRLSNAVKFRMDEAELWILTSMMIDDALYSSKGFRVYATKYVDPGADDEVVGYYPVRHEVMDIARVSQNITQTQLKRMYNESLRNAIDTKLEFYNDDENPAGAAIASAWSNEESAVQTATTTYDTIQSGVADGSVSPEEAASTGLVDPTAGDSLTDQTMEAIGSLEDSAEGLGTVMDGTTDADGNQSVVPAGDQVDAIGTGMFDDTKPIQ